MLAVNFNPFEMESSKQLKICLKSCNISKLNESGSVSKKKKEENAGIWLQTKLHSTQFNYWLVFQDTRFQIALASAGKP